MTRVRYTRDGGSYKHRDGFYADAEDREHDVSEDFADYLLANWAGHFERVGSDAENRSESGPDADATDTPSEDETPTCAGTTAGGDPCTREVSEPGAYCYQHAED